jgi:pimeloyl-[acyl-carrier protein] methyl ester esterase
MMQILAMHGWAGHAGAWSHWRKHFEQGGSTWNVAERGYGSEKPIPPAWATIPERNGPERPGPKRNVLIAHSLGLHLLPASILEKASAVVLLGSFTRFVPDGRAGRSIGAALQGMQAALGTDQELPMLERFLNKAASPHALSALPPNPCCRA